MKKVAIYLRVSTEDQEKGLKSQERSIKEYCKNHGIRQSHVVFYRDLGKSGKDLNRKAFQRLEHAIFLGEHDTVICWALDRLSRSQKDGINLLHKCLEKDIRIVSISQQFDWSGQMGSMVLGIMFALAQWQRQALSEATKRGLAQAKANGKKLGKRSKLNLNEITALLAEGVPVAQIAKAKKGSRQSIYNAIERMKEVA